MNEELALFAIDYAKQLGAQYSEARIHKIEEFSIMSRNGAVIGLTKDISNGIGVRVLVDGALGFSATNVLTKEVVKKVVEDAYTHAKALSKFMKRSIEFASAKLGRISYSVEEKKRFSDVSLDDKLRIHSEIWKVINSATLEARISVFTLRYSESIEEKVVVNSDGAFVRSKIPRLLGY